MSDEIERGEERRPFLSATVAPPLIIAHRERHPNTQHIRALCRTKPSPSTDPYKHSPSSPASIPTNSCSFQSQPRCGNRACQALLFLFKTDDDTMASTPRRSRSRRSGMAGLEEEAGGLGAATITRAWVGEEGGRGDLAASCSLQLSTYRFGGGKEQWSEWYVCLCCSHDACYAMVVGIFGCKNWQRTKLFVRWVSQIK